MHRRWLQAWFNYLCRDNKGTDQLLDQCLADNGPNMVFKGKFLSFLQSSRWYGSVFRNFILKIGPAYDDVL